MTQIYKNTTTPQPLLSTICTDFKTPLLEVKFCNLLKAYYYQNSPKIPRYSITCLVDPEVNSEFLSCIQNIEKNEKVDSIIKNETEKDNHNNSVNTGKVLIKFQSKEIIPVYLQKKEGDPEKMELEDELAKGEKVVVIYDILRYTKKNSLKTEHGISFKPTSVYYYLEA